MTQRQAPRRLGRGGTGRWIVAGVPADPGSSGGAIRAHAIFADLVARTAAAALASTSGRALSRALLARPDLRTRLASAQFVAPRALRALRPVMEAAVVDMHDDPVRHRIALGAPMDAADRARTERVVQENVARFGRVVVQSSAFADLCEVPSEKRLLIPNGTDPRTIAATPYPEGRPCVAFASGAAPGRGIELVIDTARALRAEGRDLTVALALAATGAGSRAYLDELRETLRGEEWITITTESYASMSGFLARAAIVLSPHPPDPYYDVINPVKLFDAMAAARPLVVTPRMETARIVRLADAGVVARGDQADDVATAIAELLDNPPRAARLGENGRRAAEQQYDWRILSQRLSEALLGEDAADSRF